MLQSWYKIQIDEIMHTHCYLFFRLFQYTLAFVYGCDLHNVWWTLVAQPDILIDCLRPHSGSCYLLHTYSLIVDCVVLIM